MATIVVDELITKLEYEANTNVVNEAEKAVKELESANRDAAKATDILSREQLDLAEQLAKAEQETSQLVDEQRKLKRQVEAAGKASDEQTQQLRQLNRQIEDSRNKTRELRNDSRALGRQKQRLGLDARKLARDQRKLSQAVRKATSDIRDETSAMKSSGSVVDTLTDKIAGVAGGQLAADAVTAIGRGVFELGKEVITTGANFEGLRARLKTVEGSAEGASKAFALIQDFTSTTPFQLEEVTTAFVRLKSLGLDASQDSLTAFGNLSAAQGKSIIDFIEAVADASTGEFERLKEFGIKASSQGDRVAFTFKGQTTTVGKNAKEIQAFLKGLGETEFAGAMADQMMTLNGAFSNFRDGISQAFDAIAQMGVLDEMKLLLAEVSASIDGEGGLARVIADVLVVALRTARELIAAFPQERAVEFLQQLSDLFGILVDTVLNQLTGAVNDGLMPTLFDLSATMLELVVTAANVLSGFSELRDELGDAPSILDPLIFLFEMLVKGLNLLLKVLVEVLKLLDPVIDKFKDLAASMPDFVLFDQLSEGFDRLTGSIGLFNDEVEKTAEVAGIAESALAQLAEAQGKQTTPEADAKAKQEQTRQREQSLRTAKAAKEKETSANIEAAKQDRTIRAGLSKKSLAELRSLSVDFSLSKATRDKAKKEIERREKKGASESKKQRESLLTSQVKKDIEGLAMQAGQREAARALAGGASAEEANRRELATRRAVEERITRRFAETGELPAGISQDLAQTAALPNVEQVGGRLAPPVITINNQRIEVTGNTFEANVMVEGTAATPSEIANTILNDARVVTYRDLGIAIQNAVTQQRR